MTLKKRILSLLLSLLVVIPIGFCCIPTAMAASNQDIIFDFLRSELGYNTASACGILANIEHESNFNPNIYGDHGNSYGICQWNSSRFTSLKNYCNNNGYSWQSLDGQLQFLKHEMITGNQTLHSKLKGYPNTANGAYNAGYYWCYDFERPANKAQRSVERGNLAVDKYWPLYSGEIKAPTISLTQPSSSKTTINEGDPVKIWGTVNARGAKTTVKGYIKNSSGTALQTATETTYSSLDLRYSNINNNLLFGKLKAGTYTLYITAENSKGSASVSKTIVVKGTTVSAPTTPVAPVVPVTPKVTSVKIDDIKISYAKKNNTATITPAITAETGATYTTTWASSDTSVATVDSNGKVTALKSGTATITCTVKDSTGKTVKDTCTVTVSLNWWEWILIILFRGMQWYV